MTVLEEQFHLFEIDEENEDFMKIKIDNGPIQTPLDTSLIFIIVDPRNKTIWIYHGEKVNIRKKFIAAQKAPNIRDSYGVDFRIVVVDEGSEPLEFKEIVGL
ncbi:unnamed protein product [marine sediment metagenome]|uniref:Gelsolin-like domain-containing protein n=1 Tax=marine sediment metagenome TaxID=412755 RepID=X1IQK7_9ZZZZ